jgi:uncharacterized metal-binding protein YceD (DUF177 family)
MSAAAILSLPVSATELPAAAVEIAAGAEQRAALAAANDLVAVNGLTASVEIERAPGGAIVVTGHIAADIVQTCVVSLDPVPAHIDETFSVRYVQGSPGRSTDDEVVVDTSLPDPPEVLTGNTIDVGALVEEYFVLAIDPYPRAPGATLPGNVGGVAADDASPFAALAALARKTRGFGEE